MAHPNYFGSKTIFQQMVGLGTGDGVGKCAGVGDSGVVLCGGGVPLGVVRFCGTTFSGSELLSLLVAGV